MAMDDMAVSAEPMPEEASVSVLPIAIGGIVVAAVIGLIVVLLRRKKKKQALAEEEDLADEVDRLTEDE